MPWLIGFIQHGCRISIPLASGGPLDSPESVQGVCFRFGGEDCTGFGLQWTEALHYALDRVRLPAFGFVFGSGSGPCHVTRTIISRWAQL